MTVKHKKAAMVNFDLVSLGNRIEHNVPISHFMAEEHRQYVVVEIPKSADVEIFHIALQSAVNTLAAVKNYLGQDANVLPQKDADSFADNNTRRLNQLKESILKDGHWLLAREVSQWAGSKPTVKNPSAVPNRWKHENKIFAVPSKGKDLYPDYALDDGGQPLPLIKRILDVFGGSKTPWSLAFWFGLPNSSLANHRPKDLLLSDPDAVLKAALVEKEGPVHG